MGYSFVLAIFGTLVGQTIQAQWFPHVTWSFSTGLAHIGLPGCIGIGVVVLAYLCNVVGIRVTARVMRWLGAALAVVLVLMVITSFTSGHWSGSRLTWSLPHGWEGVQTLLVLAYVAAWTTYSSEMTASFAAEYERPVGTRG